MPGITVQSRRVTRQFGFIRVLLAILTFQASTVAFPRPIAAGDARLTVPPTPRADAVAKPEAAETFPDLARFLDRLMMAESGGRDDARNPLSTAVGPFQFIESTFLDVTGRHFQSETRALERAGILKLRTDRNFARRVAEAFTRDNALALAAADIQPSFANLRLAFLVGAAGAIRVLKAEPKTPVLAILGRRVVSANPILIGMSTADLAQWSARSIALTGVVAAVPTRKPEPDAAQPAPLTDAPTVRCNQSLASCRRWVSLANKRMERPRALKAERRGARP